jgi:hypothetical protein
MKIRELIDALEAFAKKHGDDFETNVEPMWGSNPPEPLLIHEEQLILVDMGPP